jgi:GT2 family glycosyltransferase
MATLSVVIPAYNDPLSVLRALNSLQGTADGEHEYIVQDDYVLNPIGIEAVIPPCAASVRRNAKNLGFGGNCNAGAARANGDILLFFNQDCYAVPELSKGWDTELLKVFDNPLVGVAGVKLLFPTGAIQHAGIWFDGHCQPFHRYLGYQDRDYAPANQPEEVPAVTGAALAVRADVFHQLGGFDAEAYPGGYFEDIDLCGRVAQAGYAIWYQPTITFIHVVGTSGGNPNFARNAQMFKARWVDAGKIEPDVRAVKERWW